MKKSLLNRCLTIAPIQTWGQSWFHLGKDPMFSGLIFKVRATSSTAYSYGMDQTNWCIQMHCRSIKLLHEFMHYQRKDQAHILHWVTLGRNLIYTPLIKNKFYRRLGTQLQVSFSDLVLCLFLMGKIRTTLAQAAHFPSKSKGCSDWGSDVVWWIKYHLPCQYCIWALFHASAAPRTIQFPEKGLRKAANGPVTHTGELN